MQFFSPTLALLTPDLLSGTISVLVAIVVSFLILTLTASYYRFQHVVQMAEEVNPEEMGTSPKQVLRVQMARYIAGCARRDTTFSFSLIRILDPLVEVSMKSSFANKLKEGVRETDRICVFDDQTLALFMESDPEDAESILTRIITVLSRESSELLPESFRVGISSYPGHGLSGKDLISVSTKAIETASAEQRIVFPEIEVLEDEDEDLEEHEHVEKETKERVKKQKHRRESILDPLTGVLKPSFVSPYMQRLMSDWRYKKKPASLFSVGINNMDHIARVHGKETADDVISGVAKAISSHVRSEDLVGRHEEHAFLVLAQIPLENADIIARRLNSVVQQTEMVSGRKKIKTTITLGVSASPEHGRTLRALYHAAQKVLDYHRQNDIRSSAVYDPAIHDSMPSRPIRSIKSTKA